MPLEACHGVGLGLGVRVVHHRQQPRQYPGDGEQAAYRAEGVVPLVALVKGE